MGLTISSSLSLPVAVLLGGGVPSFDGHFWVERDGKVIDPYFKEYDFIKMFNGLEGDCIRVEASAHIQSSIIDLFIGCLRKYCKTDNVFKECFEIMNDKKIPLRYGNCFINAVKEIGENGGVLKFGSLGWKKKKSNKVFYEYGGVNWTKNQFLKI